MGKLQDRGNNKNKGESMKESCRQIAEKINKYLQKFEEDPLINKTDKYRTHPFYYAQAYGTTRVNICYVSYQGISKLTKEEALIYLRWLEKGNIGRHYEALKKIK
jgi:hypothetical protein